MKKNLFLIILLIHLNIFGANKLSNAQIKKYNKTLNFFLKKEYKSVIATIEALDKKTLTHPELGASLNFYYALALYKETLPKDSERVLYFIKKNWPLWDNINHIYYWLGVLNFEKENIYTGLECFNKSVDLNPELFEKILEIKLYYYKKYNLKDLVEDLYRTNEQDINLANNLLNYYKTIEIKNRDVEILNNIYNNHNLSITDEFHSARKAQRHIAIFLPLNVSNIQDANAQSLYKGLLLYLETCTNDEIYLHAYDLNQNYNMDELFDEQIKNVNAIIGPLVEPFAKEIILNAKKHNITIFDPIAHDVNVIGNNELYHLVFSSLQTKAQHAARFILDELNKNIPPNNKTTIGVIYTDEEPEIELAANFEKIINDNSDFKIISVYVPRKKLSKFLEYYIKFKKNPETEQTYLFAAIDQLTHIYLPTTNEVIASTFLSSLEINNVNAQVIVNDIWLDFESISWDKLQKNNFYFLTNSNLYANDEERENFRQKFLDKFQDIPNQFAELGYSIGTYLSKILNTNNLPLSIANNNVIKLLNPQEVCYNFAHDNQCVKIIKFTDQGLVQCN